MKKLGILLSGRGSNFLAIAESIRAGRIANAEISVVISNRADAPGIVRARELGLKAVCVSLKSGPSRGMAREQHEAQVMAELERHKVDLICLAGYMRLLSPDFVRRFPQRILNIHPSLLPAFPGMGAQKQALAAGVKISGCTVHFVDDSLDGGPIVVQRAVPVLEDCCDDAAVSALSSRILAEEHIAYTEAINIVLGGRFEVVGKVVRVFGSQK